MPHLCDCSYAANHVGGCGSASCHCHDSERNGNQNGPNFDIRLIDQGAKL